MIRWASAIILLFVVGAFIFAISAPTQSTAIPMSYNSFGAICKDGTESKSKHRSGSCSGHGGVKEWK